MERAFRAIVVAAAALVLSGYVFAAWMISRYGQSAQGLDWTARRSRGEWTVRDAAPGSAAAAVLRPGDRLRAIDSDPIDARYSMGAAQRFLQPGQRYTISAMRGEERIVASLEVPRPRPVPIGHRMAAYLVIGAAFFAMGIVMGWTQSGERVTQIGFIAWMFVAWRYLSIAMREYGYTGEPWERAVLDILRLHDPWHLSLGVHFVAALVTMARPDRPIAWVVRGYHVVAAMLWITMLPMLAANLAGPAARSGFQRSAFAAIQQAFWEWRIHFETAALFAMCGVLWRGYRLVRDEGMRRRIRWVVVGCVAGLFPLLFYQLVLNALRFAAPGYRNDALFRPWNFAANCSLAVIPIALAYAVRKHEVMGVRMVVRRGVRYLLARESMRALLLLPAAGLIWPVIRDPDRTFAELFLRGAGGANLALLAVLALGLRYGNGLRLWLDRRFFREVYDQERILRDLPERLKDAVSLDEVSRLVSTEVAAALHPRVLRVLYRDNETSGFTVGYSSGLHGGKGSEGLPANSEVLDVLRSATGPCDFPLAVSPASSQADLDWLERLETRLIVPFLGSSKQITGMLLLGDKLSEEPYTSTDRRMLHAIGTQAALVCERIWLSGRVEEEGRIRREVLGRLDSRNIQLLRECTRCGRCFDADAVRCPDDGSEVTLTLPVERLVDGKYRLDRRIGRGGMGAVYEAHDARLSRKVAVKVMMGSLFGNRDALRRFEREARASARLNHPNIVLIHDFGRVGGDGAYLVMELLVGETWRDMLLREKALPPPAAGPLLDQLLRGLDAAHRSGVAHRDLKPDNVFLVPSPGGLPVVKILDFGLAKLALADAAEVSLTVQGAVMGTLGYMAPEQLAGEESDERSDQFSFGVIAVETIAGRRPYTGRSPAELLSAMLRQRFELTGADPATRALNAVLARCLARRRQDRYPSVEAFRAPLLEAMSGCPAPAAVQVDTGGDVTRTQFD